MARRSKSSQRTRLPGRAARLQPVDPEPPAPPSREAGPVARTLWAVLVLLGVAASLVSFPGGLPWMLAGWLFVYSILTAVGSRRGSGLLLLCVAVTAVKLVDPAPPVLGLGAAFVAASLLGYRWSLARDAVPPFPIALAVLFGLWAAWGGVLQGHLATTHRSATATYVPARPVVCIGDAIVDGLAEPLGARLVVDVSVHTPGKIGAALEKIDELMADQPQLVVIALGAHDYGEAAIVGLPTRSKLVALRDARARIRGDLERLITAVRQRGAEVVLLEVPRGPVFDPFWGLERQIAREHDVELVSDTVIRSFVLYSSAYPLAEWSSGPLADETGAPNEAGLAYLADEIAAAAERIYGPVIVLDR